MVTAPFIDKHRAVHPLKPVSEKPQPPLFEVIDVEYPDARPFQSVVGFRTILATPLLREGFAIGAIIIRRTQVQPFSENQIALLQTFADQAVIAIENARLFDELQMRNRALSETLQQQTATSEILRVISQSQRDVQPVFDAIARSVTHLCEGIFSAVDLFDGELIHRVAQYNFTPHAQHGAAGLPNAAKSEFGDSPRGAGRTSDSHT